MPLGHFPETLNGCFNDLSRQMVVSRGRERVQELLNTTVAEVLFSLMILKTGGRRFNVPTETSMKQGFQ